MTQIVVESSNRISGTDSNFSIRIMPQILPRKIAIHEINFIRGDSPTFKRVLFPSSDIYIKETGGVSTVVTLPGSLSMTPTEFIYKLQTQLNVTFPLSNYQVTISSIGIITIENLNILRTFTIMPHQVGLDFTEFIGYTHTTQKPDALKFIGDICVDSYGFITAYCGLRISLTGRSNSFGSSTIGGQACTIIFRTGYSKIANITILDMEELSIQLLSKESPVFSFRFLNEGGRDYPIEGNVQMKLTILNQ